MYSDFCINQVIIGHGIFPEYWYKRYLKSNIFLCNNSEGTIEHIVLFCKLWDITRIAYFLPNWIIKSIFELLLNKKISIGIKLIVKFFILYFFFLLPSLVLVMLAHPCLSLVRHYLCSSNNFCCVCIVTNL